MRPEPSSIAELRNVSTGNLREGRSSLLVGFLGVGEFHLDAVDAVDAIDEQYEDEDECNLCPCETSCC